MKKRYDLLVIGGSAGSLSVVLSLVPELKKSLKVPVIIVFHRKPTNDTTLIDLLRERTEYDVKEADDKEEIRPNVIYLAPADYHVLLEKDRTISLDDSEKVNHCRPSIDVTFESAADVYGPSLACLLLSGANADGAEGLKAVKKKGGFVVVQDPRTAEVDYMPKQAIQKVPADMLLNRDNIRDLMTRLS